MCAFSASTASCIKEMFMFNTNESELQNQDLKINYLKKSSSHNKTISLTLSTTQTGVFEINLFYFSIFIKKIKDNAHIII